jgi:DNA modification methylase
VIDLTQPWQVITGDCEAVLPTLPQARAVITDPPYNVGLDYASYEDRRADYSEWCARWFCCAKEKAATVAITCGQSNIGVWAAIEQPEWWLAWWKPAAMGRCVVGFNNWEPIALYGTTPKGVCDVIRATIKPDPSVAGHPCPKPLEWATKQVEMFTKPGDLVIDPFCGSGTTGVACRLLDRRFIGIELDPTYASIARRRIAEAVPLGATA